ncbi:MAG TPA: DUF2325 domain-containing protein [Clostridiales bacterium]|nr:DUF2325 domain-containing protein [Clostridiales bacterium]
MNIVIVGGNECMECRYKNLCKQYHCQAKVFTKINGTLKGRIGIPDLLVLFTGTMSHAMVQCAIGEVRHGETVVARCHTSSLAALKNILEEHVA